jgi:hypothetical protein
VGGPASVAGSDVFSAALAIEGPASTVSPSGGVEEDGLEVATVAGRASVSHVLPREGAASRGLEGRNRCAVVPATGPLHSPLVAGRGNMCGPRVSLVRDPEGSPEGRRARRIVASIRGGGFNRFGSLALAWEVRADGIRRA